MFETRMTRRQDSKPALNDAVRSAVLETVRPADAQARTPEAPASFRDRLAARRATRPQSTLAIVSGIQYPALTEGARAAGKTERAVQIPQKPAAKPVTRPVPAGVHASAPKSGKVPPTLQNRAEPAPVLIPVAKFVPTPEPVQPAPKKMAASAAMAGALSVPSRSGDMSLSGGGHDDDEGGNRLLDVSQIAFAGLAVLGLAGLSVMAAESALTGKGTSDTGDRTGTSPEFAGLDPAGPQNTGGPSVGEASALAMAAASQPEAAAYQPWFDYKALAYEIAARREAQEAAQLQAEAAATADAERLAATAIADAEADRQAEEQRLARAAEDSQLVEAAAEKKRLAEAEAKRVAAEEAIRQAKLEAEEKAAAEAEARRMAELEASRIAAAEAEAQRIAEADAKQAAEAEARRLAEIETRKAAEAETRRLAELETRKLAAIAAKQAEEREDAILVSSVEPAPKPATPKKAEPQPERPAIVFAAHTGPIPAPASLKPGKPVSLIAQTPVTRTAPPTLKANMPHVRSFDRPVPVQPVSQKVEDFIARRVQRTAELPLEDEVLKPMQAEFLSVVNTAHDGSLSELITPDGRQVQIFIEQTVTREASRSVVRTVSYSVSEYNAVQRQISARQPAQVPVICRDISYAIPGAERGRFAACESGKGEWVISRATEKKRTSI